MARFVLWSDLHLETQGFQLPAKDAFAGPIDGVLLAGDIDTGQALCHLDFAEKVAQAYDVPVIMVLGNHEFYGCEVHHLLECQAHRLEDLKDRGHDIHVLDGSAITIAGVRIVGATLWTDFNLFSQQSASARRAGESGMNDYRLIKIDEDGLRPIRPQDTIEMHRYDKAAIIGHLSRLFPGPTIVMTHHLPVAQAIDPRQSGNLLDAAFASDLMDEIKSLDFDIWVYGHKHWVNEPEILISGRHKKFCANPRGYPGEKTCFNPLKVLEI